MSRNNKSTRDFRKVMKGGMEAPVEELEMKHDVAGNPLSTGDRVAASSVPVPVEDKTVLTIDFLHHSGDGKHQEMWNGDEGDITMAEKEEATGWNFKSISKANYFYLNQT